MTSLIRISEVERRTSQSRTEIYSQMKRGAFPQAVKVGLRTLAWVEDEIEQYIVAKVAARDRPEASAQS
jgi:prophage regulatory protein